MSETNKTYRRTGGTLKCLLVGLMAFVTAAAARAADWTDANSVTYTALKSINGNGSGLIVTDFRPAGTEIVKFKYKPSTISGNECVFCSRYYANNNPQAQFCGFRIASNFRFDRCDYVGNSNRGHSTCNTTTLSRGEEYSVVVNFGGESQGTITINNTAQTLSAAMKTESYTPGSVLVLFASHNNNQNVTPTASSSFGTKATGDLYYFQLWNADGETLEHDFRPAKRDSDDAIGLYDTVARKFWGATVGSFTGVELSSLATAIWIGAANNGDFSDSGNWMCYDGDGNLIADVVPGLTTYITLGADVADGWTAFNASYAGTIDVNGHDLAVSCSGTPGFSVTNSSDAVRGELRITVPEGETFTKTASFGISGNLSLVKDGVGTLIWSHATASSLAATIPVLVTNGVFKSNAEIENLLGASGTVTVKAPGQFDINTTQQYGPVRARTFYIEGDGPDGSGSIVNSAANTTAGRHLNKIALTGDATIGGRGYIDIRDNGNGIDCGGHELTVKNTGRFIVFDGGLTNATDIVISGGCLWVCNSCVLGAERIVIENGGRFNNFMDSGTKDYNVPFVIREDSGTTVTTNTITTSKNWFNILAPITVESGATLSLPNDGPWYSGAITNEAGATLNISGEFNALGGIFKNNGLLNHTAGKFVFGHRDNANYPCSVENNGIVRTSGGTFMFKAESSMSGAGTLELAGGSPQVLGTISGFMGTIVLSGGTATIANVDTFTGTLRLKGGTLNSGTSLAGFTGTAVIDVSERDDALNVDGKNWFTFVSGKVVLVDVGSRELRYGDRLISWTTTPANRVRFKFLGEHPGELRKDGEGVVYGRRRGMMIIVQ